jgi:hypothetical protein
VLHFIYIPSSSAGATSLYTYTYGYRLQRTVISREVRILHQMYVKQSWHTAIPKWVKSWRLIDTEYSKNDSPDDDTIIRTLVEWLERQEGCMIILHPHQNVFEMDLYFGNHFDNPETYMRALLRRIKTKAKSLAL